MTNLEVAREYVENALAYAKDGKGYMQTVIANLEYIKKLLKKPDGENFEHDWDDFK
jgi:hypothetical protein